MMGEPFKYNRTIMIIDKYKLLLDGKPTTYSEIDKAMDRELSEGRDVTIIEGSPPMTRIVSAQGYVPAEPKTAEEQSAFEEFRRSLSQKVSSRVLTEGCGETTTDGQTIGQVTGMEGQVTTSDGRTMSMAVERFMDKEMQRALSWASMEGHAETTTDEQTVEQTIGTEEQTLPTGTDEQMTMTMGEEIVVEVDPLALSPSASVDTVLASPGTSKYFERVVPEADFDSDDMDHERQKGDDGSDVDSVRGPGRIGRRVAGRRLAVLDDDSDAMSIVSITSTEEGSLLAASSSRTLRSKGTKRRLEPVKEKERTEETGSSEEKKGKKKGKKKGTERKDTPEEEDTGKYGEPMGMFDIGLADMSSEVLGGAIMNWANEIEDIRSKSKNMQGKLSGRMKKVLVKIKDGAALLVVRSTAKGDPDFLRMRNTEMAARLREVEGENARLLEQIRRKSPVMPSPPRKKKKEKVAEVDAADTVMADLVDPDVDSPFREEFPPLPQRTPRAGVALDGSRKKIGPRIVSDVQVAPPFIERSRTVAATPAVSGSEAEWRVAAGSRRRGRVKGEKPPLPSRPPPVPTEGRPPPARRQQPKVRLPKPPTSSAVTITGKTEGFSYADVMRKARENIKLEDLGITATHIRKALNGGLVVEVSGEGSRLKAEELVTQLRNVLGNSAAVSCPVKKRELTVAGFDESVTAEEIAEELSNIGGCLRTDIKMGPVRTTNSGLGIVWVQLPVAAAAKAAEAGRIRAGWTMARVELLKARPLQCYKCWSFGHVQTTCRSVVDRREACFRCGQKGHIAGKCTNPVHCAVCHDAGLEASHRLGGSQCAAQERQTAKK